MIEQDKRNLPGKVEHKIHDVLILISRLKIRFVKQQQQQQQQILELKWLIRHWDFKISRVRLIF